MNRRSLLISFIALLLFSSIGTRAASTAEEEEVLKHHLILAINWSPRPNPTDGWESSHETKEAVKRLSKYIVKDGKGDDREVLTTGDYYSCVAFRAEVLHNTLDHFVQPIVYQDQPVVFWNGRDHKDFSKRVSNDWRNWLRSSPFQSPDNASFSLLTVAKPYCLHYFSGVPEKKEINRTFMIVVTDRTFNGDMYNEILNLQQFNIHNHLTGIKDDDVYPICYAVNQSYFIRHIKTEAIRHNGNAWSNPQGYVDLYEFVPLQKNFQLATVLDLPAHLKARRVRGNKYACDLSLSNRRHPSYMPVRLEASLDSTLLKRWNENELPETTTYTFEVESSNRPKTLHLKGWVRLIDDVYNTTLLSPSPRATEEAGRDGLHVAFEIAYEPKAKVFFLPMPDIMWFSFFPDDQATAALVWELIIGFLLLVATVILVIYLFNKNQYFTPSVDEIKFKLS
ncbi:hypothetical protein M2480_000569 [Parabacteroides sp. PFB2-12]|uniref:hypothetical protein n=1 Tax=unclassified Parabacteroides TaxID=2649774 RepID=UPI002477268F|nr:MULTISPECIES: hypothetical protein [unclassified Parabacteroides]MDH6341906.1 hypothetical protein [Parabacteroides sp. PM6-13]MDH6389604.1 hypothetical protein [Parabacteroides sp. PFB2-12]